MTAPAADKDFLAGMSRQARGVMSRLILSLDALGKAFAAHEGDARSALYAASAFRAALDAIDATVSAAPGGGAGPGLSAEEAAMTGTLVHADPFAAPVRVTLAEALTTHVAGGAPFVIAGAGAPLSTMLGDMRGWMGQIGSGGLVVQYVGVDRQLWSPARAIAPLEINLLQAAAAQAFNSAMNAAGRKAVVVSQGFGCWVANRALLALPVQNVWDAHNLQIDALGDADAMADLAAVKDGGYGAVCHIQGDAARAALATEFGLSQDTLVSMPVDIRA